MFFSADKFNGNRREVQWEKSRDFMEKKPEWKGKNEKE